MNTWSKIRFGDLFLDGTKNGIYKEAEFHGSGTKVVNMGQVFEYSFISNQEMERYQLTEEELRKYSLIDGDLVFARRSLVDSGAGKAAIVIGVTEPMVFESSIIRVRLDPSKCVPLFYLYWLQSFAGRSAIRALVSGTSVKGIKGSDLPNMLVDYPSIEIQKAIASLLHQYDEKIKNNELINANLEALCQTKYNEIIEEIMATGEDCTLADIGDIIGGSTPSKAVSEYYCESGIPWLTPKDLSEDKSKFISRGSIDLTEAGLNSCSAKLMPRGSILYTSRAPIGYIAISKNEICTNQGFKSLVPKESYYRSFIYYYLKNNFEMVNGVASGSTFLEVSGTAMKSLPAFKPSKQIANEFESYCTPLFEMQEALEEENCKLTALRDYLLPKLMSGEIDVSDLSLPN